MAALSESLLNGAEVILKQSKYSGPVKFKICGSTGKALLIRNFKNVEYWIPNKALLKVKDFYVIKKWFLVNNIKMVHDLFY